MRTLKWVCVSGYFDPLHGGHIDYLKTAKLLGDVIIVKRNRDLYQTETERQKIYPASSL